MDNIKQSVFEFFQILLKIYEFIVSRFLSQKQQNHHYESSAQLSNIWLRYKPAHRLEFSSKNDFLCTHQKFVHPNTVLQDCWSLYVITPKEAIFIDSEDLDVFNSKHDAFVYNTQFDNAKHMITMPISSFYLVANQVQPPTVPIIHLANHGRCGSTLIAKIFEAIPNSLSISEMNAFTDIAELTRKGSVEREALKKLCFGTMMFIVNHCHNRKSKVVLIKCQNISLYITDILADVLPSMKQIYMYRQPVPFVQSYEKLNIINGWSPLTVKLTKVWCGIGHNQLLLDYPVYPFHILNKLHFFSKYGLIWITSAAAYNALIKKGYVIKSLKYEDFLKDPKITMQNLFQYCNIPEDLLPVLEKIMSRDSQTGTKFTSRTLDKKELEEKFTHITDELKAELDELCKDFDVPQFWGNVLLENPI